jgi:hypothetical protein
MSFTQIFVLLSIAAVLTVTVICYTHAFQHFKIHERTKTSNLEKVFAFTMTEKQIVDYLVGFSESKPPTTHAPLVNYHSAQLHHNAKISNQTYVQDMEQIMQNLRTDQKKLLPVIFGDINDKDTRLVLTKSRAVGGEQSLLPLNTQRHNKILKSVLESEAGEVPYEHKSDRLVWRGATTGLSWNSQWWSRHNTVREQKHNRLALVLRYQDETWCDIGFNKQAAEPCAQLGCSQIRMKQRISPEDWLNHKVLLAVEGNDVSSALRWMMAADSVVLMPHPTCETVFCEGLLVPWIHYVPVKPDFSDLKLKYYWILQNPQKAFEIRTQSQFWAHRFSEDRQFERSALCMKRVLQQLRRLKKRNIQSDCKHSAKAALQAGILAT